MHTHVPGPWIVRGDRIVHQQNAGGRKTEIADCIRGTAHPEQVRANAQLIAAAPDLLMACLLAERALNLPSDYVCTCEPDATCQNCLTVIDASEALRKVIAKVRS